MIEAGSFIFTGCQAQEAFRMGAGGASGRALLDGSLVHVKLPDSPKCPIGPAAAERGADGRVRAFKQVVAAWERRLNAFSRCEVRNYMIETTKLVLFDPSPRVRRMALISPFQGGLESPLDRAGTLSVAEKLAFTATTLVQLAQLHEVGMVHADLKPANCPLYRTGGTAQARMLDFDNSFFIGEPPPPDDYGFDPYYAAPEVMRYIRSGSAGEISPKVDTFSLGVMLAEMWAAGRMPGSTKGDRVEYPADLMAHRRFDPAAWLRGARVEEPVIQMLTGMLAADAARRLVSGEASRMLADAYRLQLPGTPDRSAAPAKAAAATDTWTMKKPEPPRGEPGGDISFAGMRGLGSAPAGRHAVASSELPHFGGMRKPPRDRI